MRVNINSDEVPVTCLRLIVCKSHQESISGYHRDIENVSIWSQSDRKVAGVRCGTKEMGTETKEHQSLTNQSFLVMKVAGCI